MNVFSSLRLTKKSPSFGASTNLCVAVISLLFSVPMLGQEHNDAIEDNMPRAIEEAFHAPSFAAKYRIDATRNPFYLRGDFDGDGHPDYAVVIQNESHKAGIAIWLSSRSRHSLPLLVLGAGSSLRIDFTKATPDDLSSFLDFWVVFDQGRVLGGPEQPAPPPKLLGDAILCGQYEGGSILLYWNGRRFASYPQGD